MIAYIFGNNAYKGNIDDTYQNRNLSIFLAFVAWLMIVSLLAEESVQLSFAKVVEVAKVFLLCFLFARLITTEYHIKAYVWVTSLSFGALSFWGFLQSLAGNGRLDTLWPGGSNYIAAQLALMAPLVFANVLSPTLSARWKLLFLACTLWIVLCCIYTDSRRGFIGLIVGMFIFAVWTKQPLKKVVASVGLIAVLVYPWIPASYSERITSIFASAGDRDDSADSRPVLWRIALRIWQDHPIAGVGLENFSLAKERYATKVDDIVTSREMFALIFNRQRYPYGLYPGMMADMLIV